LLTSWRRGRQLLAARLMDNAIPRDQFIELMVDDLPRVEGTAIFMTSARDVIPGALLHNLKHNKVLHERVIFLTVVTSDEPFVPESGRIEMQDLGRNFWRILVHYGFMQEPNVPKALAACAVHGLEFELMESTFFVSRESVLPTDYPGMALWREHLFAWMMRNAGSATDFFGIPANRVVEMGTQLEI
ncbi:MAG: potassium transport protein Kup, partial [Pseudomonadota bacterium]